MSCESVQERISSHLDGMLTGEEQENVLAHLESCRACSAQWKSLLALRTGLRRLDRPRVPAHLAVQLRVLASHERVRQLALMSEHLAQREKRRANRRGCTGEPTNASAELRVT